MGNAAGNYELPGAQSVDPATAQTMQAFLHWAANGGSTVRFMQKPHIFARPLPKAVSVLSDAQIATFTN